MYIFGLRSHEESAAIQAPGLVALSLLVPDLPKTRNRTPPQASDPQIRHRYRRSSFQTAT